MNSIAALLARYNPRGSNFNKVCQGSLPAEALVELNTDIAAQISLLTDPNNPVTPDEITSKFGDVLNQIVFQLSSVGSAHGLLGFVANDTIVSQAVTLQYHVQMTWFEGLEGYLYMVCFQTNFGNGFISHPTRHYGVLGKRYLPKSLNELVNDIFHTYQYKLLDTEIDIVYHELLNIFPRKS